jgi:hypothetical protein
MSAPFRPYTRSRFAAQRVYRPRLARPAPGFAPATPAQILSSSINTLLGAFIVHKPETSKNGLNYNFLIATACLKNRLHFSHLGATGASNYLLEARAMLEAMSASESGHIPFQARILNGNAAALVWKLSWDGAPKHIIAAKLGTMPSRVDGILAENTHVGSKQEAIKMFPPERN